MSAPSLSVVIATFNRWSLLERLLRQLADQTLEPKDYEVVVVDDGSTQPVKPLAAALKVPYALKVEAQANQGAAAARHHGVLCARAPVLIILDDDMQVGREFLARHLAHHARGDATVVVGRIAADPGVAEMPLFERWYQHLLDQMAAGFESGAAPLRGNDLYTGNVSLRRADYLAVGGFDASLGQSEDAELGLRLEAAGAQLKLDGQAVTFHGSDHTDFSKWRHRARSYGAFDHRVAQKHPLALHASPWRFFTKLSPLARPFMLAAVSAPRAAGALSIAAYQTAAAADRLRLKRLALAGTTLAYGLEYFAGLREEVGSMPKSVLELVGLLARTPPGVDAAVWRHALSELSNALVADLTTLKRYQAKYGDRPTDVKSVLDASVTKIGFQMMVAYRLMRALVKADAVPLAKVASRLIRHLYSAEIHWEMRMDPGVMLVHGTGLTLSRAAVVGRDCVLSQNVTLGMGTDPQTRKVGAPTLEDEVHVGPGATLIGPIVVGRKSKIMPGAVLTRSVPPGSRVEAPDPKVTARVGPRAAAEAPDHPHA